MPVTSEPTPERTTSPKGLRIAIVSYYAPPQPAVAAHRVLRLSRTLLAAGHEVHWVTLDERKLLERDQTLADLVPAGVVRHGLGGPTLASLPAARSFTEKVMRTLYHKLPQWLALPDKHVEWTFRLRRQLPKLAVQHRFDVVLMTCGPHGQILSIPQLRRAAPNVRIVVDYRDLLTGNAWTSRDSSRVRQRLQQRERQMLGFADAVFVNSEEALASFQQHVGALPCPVRVMRNAADYGLAAEIDRRWPVAPLGEGCHLGFFGTIFPRRRMVPVLEAMARLSPAVLRNTTLHIYCDARDSRQLLEEDLLQVPEVVRTRVLRHDYLPFAEALRSMRWMSALVLVNGKETADNIFVPGKLYDYVMARRPILFVGNRGDAWRIVEAASGGGRCFTYDEGEQFAAGIAALQQRPADLPPAEEYGSERTFEPLLEWLRELRVPGRA
jgi:hypothetical protein